MRIIPLGMLRGCNLNHHTRKRRIRVALLQQRWVLPKRHEVPHDRFGVVALNGTRKGLNGASLGDRLAVAHE